MALKLTILGCSGTYAAAGNACSGYLVANDDTVLWVDTGPGTLANAQRHVDLDDVDAIVISHSHPDHWLDLPVLRNVYRYVLGREAVPLYSTEETIEKAQVVCDQELAPTFDVTVIDETSSLRIGSLGLTFSRTDHPVETLAMRIEADGQALAYSADTGPGWSFDRFGAPIDLALCEATLGPEDDGLAPHVTGQQAGTIAANADVGRLVITHAMPGHDLDRRRAETEAAFGRPVEVAHVGDTFTL